MLNKKEEIKKTIFPALTGFRAIATWVIFVYHFFPFKNVEEPLNLWIRKINKKTNVQVKRLKIFLLSIALITTLSLL